MIAKDHPDYLVEEKHLRATIAEIEKKKDNLLQSYGIENLYAPPDTIRLMSKQAVKEVQRCKDALFDLYFGRVDWEADEKDEPEKFYIGKSPLYPLIIAWQETLASDLYYNRTTDKEGGRLNLVRTFRIEDKKLLEIEDDFQDPSLTGEIDPDSLLASILYESKGELKEIISTINTQQNRIIRAPLSNSLIVQGAPGSGKTVIALHRVAYLLYNYQDLRSQKILVLGPNPLFMQYVSSVLPSLGERQIPQLTFDQWLIEQLGGNISYQSQEELLEFLLSTDNPVTEKIMHLRNCQSMGSLLMGKLLERYVNLLREEVIKGKPNLVCRYQPLGTPERKPSPFFVERSLDEIRTTMNDVRTLPFNQQRDAVELRLSNDITAEVARKINFPIHDRDRYRKEVFDEIQRQVHEYFSNWRAQNVSIAYRRLFRQRDMLQSIGEDLFSRWDLELMSIDAPTALTPFRFSDLVGLLYLKVLLDGTGKTSYGHIIVDEAQDIPPLFFDGLRRFIPRKSITILGDIGQGVFLNYGLPDWQDLDPVFPSINSAIEELNICYRSTWEIMQYANSVLLRTGTGIENLIRPLNRPGQPVILHPSSTEKQHVKEIIRCVQEELDNEWNSIAIICKSASECHQLANVIRSEGFTKYQLIVERDGVFQPGVLILPSYLAKGLEFDVVILSDGHRYQDDDLSLRLLFVAITRAAHRLHICWQGEISPLLDEGLERVEIKRFLADRDSNISMTIDDYSVANRIDDSDTCVELLARSGRLPLLREGEVDPIVMDLVIQTNKQFSRISTEDVFIEDLDKKIKEQIRTTILVWQEQNEYQEGLALSQTAFGLFRNHMRNLELLQSGDDDFDLVQQITHLIRFRKLIFEEDLSLPGGRWTTRERVKGEVDIERLHQHEIILQILLDFGVIETQLSSGDLEKIRTSPQWIRDLLDLSIGIEPQGLDSDLLDQLSKPPSILNPIWEVK